jgi:hypothetical protein
MHKLDTPYTISFADLLIGDKFTREFFNDINIKFCTYIMVAHNPH